MKFMQLMKFMSQLTQLMHPYATEENDATFFDSKEIITVTCLILAPLRLSGLPAWWQC